jgi:hypothetical protein
LTRISLIVGANLLEPPFRIRVYLSQIPSRREAEWEAFSEMCSFEYWTRVWVVQEIILAERITIHCGEDGLDWDTFSAARHQLANAYHYLMDIPKAASSFLRASLEKIDLQRETKDSA